MTAQVVDQNDNRQKTGGWQRGDQEQTGRMTGSGTGSLTGGDRELTGMMTERRLASWQACRSGRHVLGRDSPSAGFLMFQEKGGFGRGTAQFQFQFSVQRNSLWAEANQLRESFCAAAGAITTSTEFHGNNYLFFPPRRTRLCYKEEYFLVGKIVFKKLIFQVLLNILIITSHAASKLPATDASLKLSDNTTAIVALWHVLTSHQITIIRQKDTQRAKQQSGIVQLGFTSELH